MYDKLRYLGLHLRHKVVQVRSRVLDRPSAEVKLRQAREHRFDIGTGGGVGGPDMEKK